MTASPMTPEKAAKFFIVAWCKGWRMWLLRDTLLQQPLEGRKRTHGELLALTERCHELFPWMPTDLRDYGMDVRLYVGGAYPALSKWLFERACDVDRLGCADQVVKLRAPDFYERKKRAFGNSEKERQRERLATKREYGATTLGAVASGRAYQSTLRSAWNVCKA
jgi:hypothetical protein